MAGYADELSLKLTTKDEMSSRLKAVKKELTAVEKQMAETRRQVESTGAPEAIAELKRLERQYDELAAAQRAMARENAQNEQSLKRLRSEAGRTASSMDRLGGSIRKHQKDIQRWGLVAGAAMAYFASTSVKAFADAEKQQMQLQESYRKFPKIADVSIESMRALNDELMNLTGADNDALAASEALLARFDLTGSQIMQLIPLVNDYAIATGKDLPEAADTIGKAFMGNARAMKSLGIDFKATGDRGKDLAAIMGALEDKVGGAGKAFGGTTAGQLAIAQQNFAELQETVGAALVPALQGLVAVTKPIVALLRSMPQPVQQIVMGIGALGIAAMIATPRIIAMNDALASRGGLLGVAGKGKKAAAGIAAVTAAVLALQVAKGDKPYLFDVTNPDVDIEASLKNIIQPGFQNQALRNPFESVWNWLGVSRSSLDAYQSKIADADSQLALLVSNGKADEAAKQFKAMTDYAATFGGTVDDVKALLPGYESALASTGEATSGLADDTADAVDEVSALGRALDRVMSVASRQRALRSLRKAIKDALADGTKDSAYQAIDAFDAAFRTFKDGSQEQAQFVQDNYARIASVIEKSGLSDAAQKELLDPLREAKLEADRLIGSLRNIQATSITVQVRGGKGVVGFADGGAVWGPGTGTSDSIPAMLSNGEYVIRQAAAERIGYATLDRLNSADRIPALPPIVHAPAITLPAASVGRDAPLVGQLVLQPQGQVDVELALTRVARQQAREARTRHARARVAP